jgi:Capsular polysaccharide biosynthesis protein
MLPGWRNKHIVQGGPKSAGLEIELEFAAEYFVDFDFFKTMESDNLLTFSGNHILIEISTFSAPPNLFDTVFQLRVKGYQPILAHPERYVYFANLEAFEKLKDFGCLFQTNILSLAGQ